jgi:ATP-dependent helicase HrpA
MQHHSHLQFKYPDLPIIDARHDIIKAVRKNQVVVITGETGCGKTTQLPLLCLEAAGQDSRIAVTQPRRIAAISIARRVSENIGFATGGLAGFKTRFDECVSGNTQILFQTDGMLVTEIGQDRFLNKYNVIMIDEAHERNLNIDIITGHLRWLAGKRRDLKIIISSATIHPELFSHAFGNAPIIHIKGRTFPIRIIHDPYDESKTDHVQAAVNAVDRINTTDENGDILIFMPTERDILSVKRKLDAMKHFHPTSVLPLFARLSRAHQELIFRPVNTRKIIIATNIAETSVTVPGIRFVIDSGLSRIKRYQSQSRITALPVERISRASADQRTGRCGRTQEGICIRLYSKEDYDNMEEFTPAEILRCNMAGVILSMTSRRLGNMEHFAFLEPPPAKSVKDGYMHLMELDAIDQHKRLTATGAQMSIYPIDPHLSRILVEAKKNNALPESLIIVSALSCMDVRERPIDKTEEADQTHKKFGDPASDFLWYLNIWKKYHDEWAKKKSQADMREFCRKNFISFMRMKEWRDIHAQLSRISGKNGSGGGADFQAIHQSLLSGFIANIALRNTETKLYRMSHGGAGTLFPGSMLSKKNPDWIMFAEKVETSRIFMRTASLLDPGWINKSAPHLIKKRYSEPYFEEESGIVRATEHIMIFGLDIGEKGIAYGRINPAASSEIFIREGLIENRLNSHHKFIKRNMEIRNEVETLQAKLRTGGLYAGDDVLFDWYSKKIPEVTSIHDLNRAIHEHSGDSFLYLSINDITRYPLPPESDKWPDVVRIGGENFKCTYLYDPSDISDGITVHFPPDAEKFISQNTVSWLIKPQWEKRIEAMLECMPRDERKKISPLKNAAEKCASLMKPCHRHFCEVLSDIVNKEFDTCISADMLMNADIPVYLNTHAAFNDRSREVAVSIERWLDASSEMNKLSVTSWNFGDIPSVLEISDRSTDVPLYRFPALKAEGNSVDLVTFSSMSRATAVHAEGVAALTKKELSHEFAWIGKNSRIDRLDRLAISSIGDPDLLAMKTIDAITKEFGVPAEADCRSADVFNRHLDNARQNIPIAMRSIMTILSQSGVLAAKISGDIAAIKKSTDGTRLSNVLNYLTTELKTYIQKISSDEADHIYLRNFQRYLKRLDITVQRAKNDPMRYLQRMNSIQVYEMKLNASNAPLKTRCLCRNMLEEYKISIFAQQEVKAMQGTSEKKTREIFENI